MGEDPKIRSPLKDGIVLDIIEGNPKYLQLTKLEGNTSIDRIKLTRPIDNVTLNTVEGKALIRKSKKIYDKIREYEITKDELRDMLEDALLHCTEQYNKSMEDAKDNESLENKEKEKEYKKKVKEGSKQLDILKRPILWTASNIDWYTAGERMNILLAWIAFCGQVVLKEQISVIVEGEGGTGKTHIQSTALDMIPEESVLNMKSSTMAAVYAMADTDPWYFDNKIVNMGDMGGDFDHEEAEEFKNIMKELQSDGYVKRVKMVKGPGGEQIPKEYILYGHPILTYTNVPGHKYDDQEMSRSIILRPRKDHKNAFMIFKRLNKQKGTDSSGLIKNHRDMIPIIQNMVRALKFRMEEVTIYNPYWSFMEEYLSNSKYIFRDTDKYDAILRVITAINGYNRKIHDVNGQKTLFTSREDIGFFLELLDQYHKSIVSNISPGAMDLLENLNENAEVWFNDDRGNDDQKSFKKGLTINKYIEESSNKLSRQTLKKYFKELADVGYLKIIREESQQYVYDLGKDSVIDAMGEVHLSKLDQKIMEFNYGNEITLTFEDEEQYGISLWDMHPEVEAPMWNKYLPA